jgi:transcription-repair coupling factor (superfamily II helicase)
VGFTLYCQLLKRTIAILNGEKIPELVDVKLNLDFLDLSPASGEDGRSASLPYGYIEEDSQRMAYLKRLAEASENKSVSRIAAELKDRFGALPAAARRLLSLAKLRIACAAGGISRIDVKSSRAVFCRNSSNDIAFVTTLKGKSPEVKIAELILSAKSSAGSRPSPTT